MPKISACIISYNEEKKIGDCLASLVSVVDEIIVVDSFSTDRTLEIASRFTDKIYQHEFEGYVKQKRFAVEKASYDWILNLDCDERLDERLAASVLEHKETLEKASAYRMSRKTFYVYRWLEYCWQPDYKIRLFHRQKANWVGEAVHEKVEVREGRTETMVGCILHYSFDSISDHLKTIDAYTEIGAREIIARGNRVSIISPITHGFWTFFRMFVLRRGFLDGFAGMVVSVLSGMHSFVKYCKVILFRKASLVEKPNNR